MSARTEMTHNDGGTDGGRKRLLVVDPDALLRWSIQTHLSKWFKVQVTDSPEAALESLESFPTDAVIASDQLGERIREIDCVASSRNRNVRIVHLTTGGAPIQGVAGVSCVEKPFRFSALLDALGVGGE